MKVGSGLSNWRHGFEEYTYSWTLHFAAFCFLVALIDKALSTLVLPSLKSKAMDSVIRKLAFEIMSQNLYFLP